MSPTETEAIERVLRWVKCPTIVNLGAYQGEEDAEFRRMSMNHEIIHLMLEPDPLNCAVAANRMGPGSSLSEAAVGRKTERRLFFPSYDSRDGAKGSGSLLEPTGHLTHFPTIHFGSGREVQVYSLDDLYERYLLKEVQLLWMDVQGAEAEVIEGGQQALRKTRFCFMEAESVEFYKGQVLKPDLIKRLKGWDLVEDFGYNVLLRNSAF